MPATKPMSKSTKSAAAKATNKTPRKAAPAKETKPVKETKAPRQGEFSGMSLKQLETAKGNTEDPGQLRKLRAAIRKARRDAGMPIPSEETRVNGTGKSSKKEKAAPVKGRKSTAKSSRRKAQEPEEEEEEAEEELEDEDEEWDD